MPVSKETFNKLAKRAAGNYAKKIKLEKPLAKKVSALLKVVRKDVAQHGTAHLEPHRKVLEKILIEHHENVASKFSHNLRDIIGKPSNDKIMQRKLDANIKGYAAQRGHLMSHQIMDTTRDNIDKSMRDASIDAALEEEAVTHAEIAESAASLLIDKFIDRSVLIATTETQAAAESGKWLELDTMIDMDSEIDDVPVKEMTQKKIWIAILDDHTREDHAEADAQEQDIDDPFEVGGEQLMTPGDDSLGATPGNLCNCRCSFEVITE